jgi:hypothetical protein
VYIDGLPIGLIDYRINPDQFSDVISFDSGQMPNGSHDVKLAAVDSNGVVTLSANLTITVLNDFYYFTKDDGFNDTGFNISAINASPKETRVKIYSWADGSLKWTSTATAGNLDCRVPKSILTGAIYDIAVETRPLSLMSLHTPVLSYVTDSSDWEQIWNDAIAKHYDPEGYYRVQIFLPRGDSAGGKVADCRKKAVAELARWGAGTGGCAVWYYDAATWKTFSTQVTRSYTEIVYIVSHGFPNYGNVNVLNFLISKERSWYTLGGVERVFSKPKAGLPPVGTTGIHYLRELNLPTITRNRFMVYHSACWMGYNMEMANEWMNCGLNRKFASFPQQMPLYQTDWQEWDYQIWNHWCDSRTPWLDALQGAEMGVPGAGSLIREQLTEGSCGDDGILFN